MVLKEKKGTHNVKHILRHQRVERSDAEEVPSTLGEAKGALSEADHDAMEARDGFLEYVWAFDLPPPCHAQSTIVFSERVIIPNFAKLH